MKSTIAIPAANSSLDFSDPAVAFASKSDQEVRLAYWLFRLVRNRSLVKVGGKLALWAVELGLPVQGLIRKTLYRHFCGGRNLNEAEAVMHALARQNVQTVLDYAAEAQTTEVGYDMVMGEVLRNIKSARNNSDITCISLKMTGIGPTPVFEKLQAGQLLTLAEELAYERCKDRLNRICKEARADKVTVFIDAEESWLQDPIDALAEDMMLRYNRSHAVVFNTLQMYRTDRLAYLKNLLQRYAHSNCIMGIKLVRGAYLEKEQLRAEQQGYACPVFTEKEQTDKSFDDAVDLTLQHLHHAELCAATHNEHSSRRLASQIDALKLSTEDRRKISFSQLYGMSDNLTYTLARAGFRTSKYLPYGNVGTALPYLLRRAEENSSISGQMGRELQLLHKEMKRRKLA